MPCRWPQVLHILWRSPRKCPVEFGVLVPRVHQFCIEMQEGNITTRELLPNSTPREASFATHAERWDYTWHRTRESHLKISWAKHLWEKALALEVPLLPVDEECWRLKTAQTFESIWLRSTVVSHKFAQCCRVIQPIRALSQIRLQSICRRGVLLKHASNLSLARCVFALLLGLPQETQKEVNIFLLALQITRRFKSQQLHMESHGGIYIILYTLIY